MNRPSRSSNAKAPQAQHVEFDVARGGEIVSINGIDRIAEIGITPTTHARTTAAAAAGDVAWSPVGEGTERRHDRIFVLH